MTDYRIVGECAECGIQFENARCPVCGRPSVPVPVPEDDEQWVAEDAAAAEAVEVERAEWRPTNPYAVAGLTMALLGGSVLAIIFGNVALGQIDRYGREGGRAVARTAIVLGTIEIAVVVLYVFAKVVNA